MHAIRPRPALRGHIVAAFACALLALLLTTPAAALDPNVPFQHYRLDHWGVDEGLPQISVLSIIQSRRGYLWIGTQSGIVRFDGNRFTVYDHTTIGVDTTDAQVPLVTSDGLVWFGTPRGLLKIDGEVVSEIGRGASMTSVVGLAQTPTGQLLAASASGVYSVDHDRLVAMPALRDPAYCLSSDGSDVWIGGSGTIIRLHAGIVERITLPDPAMKVMDIVRDGNGLWLGTPSGLRRFDLKTHAIEDVAEVGASAVESLLRDRSGNLWVGTLERLLRRRPDGRWETVQDSDLFTRPWIVALFEDREGGLWLGSHYESLVRLRDSAISRIGSREGLADPFVWSVLRDRNGDLLIGTNSGVIAVGADGVPRTLVAGKDLPQPQAYTLAQDPDGTLWIGTRGGLAVLRGGKVTVPPALLPLHGLQIDAVQRVGDGDYWIATLAGLYRYRNGELQASGPTSSVPEAQVRTILAQVPDDLLIGTGDGIFRIHGGQRTRLPGTQALNGSFVSRLAWLRPGLLGITTVDRGLGLWRDGHLLLLGPEAGLPCLNGWTLDVIGHDLYVASIDGLYRVILGDLPEPTAKPPYRLQAHVVVEGSQHTGQGRRFGCCNGGGDARTLREGAVLWIATSTGVVRLDTIAIPRPAAPPAAHIERVHSGEQIYPGDRPLHLDGDHRDFDIQYTGLSLVESERLEFRYWLEGYDRGWHDASPRRVAFYTHLPPGDYRFRVQARAPFGPWGVEGARLAIHVIPLWYERYWVRIGGVLLAMLLLVAAVRRHNSGLRRRSRQLQQAVDERTRALRDANSSLETLSRTDSLTGLSNRRALDNRTPGVDDDWTGAVLLIDLDHFKRINDRHGHAYGDEVLVALSEILRTNTRTDDRVLRWGGEEFLIVTRRLDSEAALALGERIRHTLSARQFKGHDGKPLQTTCSIGIARLPVHPVRNNDLDASIALADMALYHAKRQGRNRVYAVELPQDAVPGTSQNDLREEAERLDALGKLQWRSPSDAAA